MGKITKKQVNALSFFPHSNPNKTVFQDFSIILLILSTVLLSFNLSLNSVGSWIIYLFGLQLWPLYLTDKVWIVFSENFVDKPKFFSTFRMFIYMSCIWYWKSLYLSAAPANYSPYFIYLLWLTTRLIAYMTLVRQCHPNFDQVSAGCDVRQTCIQLPNQWPIIIRQDILAYIFNVTVPRSSEDHITGRMKLAHPPISNPTLYPLLVILLYFTVAQTSEV